MSRWIHLGVVAALLLALQGCGLADPSPKIRARFQAMVGYLCQGDVDGCVTLADPVYVRAQGMDSVKLRLTLLAGVLTLAQVTEADVRIDDLVVADDRKSAEVRYSLQIQGEWKPQSASRWVLSDGQWYMAF